MTVCELSHQGNPGTPDAFSSSHDNPFVGHNICVDIDGNFYLYVLYICIINTVYIRYNTIIYIMITI